MPQIGENLWKTALSYYWWRQYADGRIEQEFDLLIGQIRPWGAKTPDGLIKAGWRPVTPDLAAKMPSCGEFGIPTPGPAVIVEIRPGDELVIYKDVTIWDGYRVRCKACNNVFMARSSPKVCPHCKAELTWRCPECTALSEQPECKICHVACRLINPFETVKEMWEELEYFVGIKGKFLNRFNPSRLVTTHE